jgi:26S proteasome regulatory subunit N10
MLERALAMSMDQPSVNTTVASAAPAAPVYPDFATMTEEEQIAYAMQMSMAEARKFFVRRYVVALCKLII